MDSSTAHNPRGIPKVPHQLPKVFHQWGQNAITICAVSGHHGDNGFHNCLRIVQTTSRIRLAISGEIPNHWNSLRYRDKPTRLSSLIRAGTCWERNQHIRFLSLRHQARSVPHPRQIHYGSFQKPFSTGWSQVSTFPRPRSTKRNDILRLRRIREVD
jgi:hypothetical protein